jgi:hypothetical protein
VVHEAVTAALEALPARADPRSRLQAATRDIRFDALMESADSPNFVLTFNESLCLALVSM